MFCFYSHSGEIVLLKHNIFLEVYYIKYTDKSNHDIGKIWIGGENLTTFVGWDRAYTNMFVTDTKPRLGLFLMFSLIISSMHSVPHNIKFVGKKGQ